MIQAVIFDMDGLMIDSEPFHFIAYQKVLSDFGINYSSRDNQKYIGRADIEVSNDLVEINNLSISGAELFELKKKVYIDFLINEIRTKDGLFEILEILKEKKLTLAVASSSPIKEIKLVLDKFSISSFFNVVVSGEFVKKSKPEPDIFLLTAERLKIEPEQCLVLEDSYNGMLAAKKANMKCYVIPGNETKDINFEKADKVLSSLSEVTENINQN